MESGFTTRVVVGPEGCVIYVSGELDIATASKLTTAAETAISSQSRAVRIDLAEVDFMDSTGLSAILQARDHAVDRGLPFYVSRPRPTPARVFELTGMAEILTILDGDETADLLAS